uniref:Ig-like domain-containing protein n=1 Tax=Salmo trutta TaxID=8032 RepID=A0A673XSW1_SALTR
RPHTWLLIHTVAQQHVSLLFFGMLFWDQGVTPRFCLLHSLFAEACPALTPAFHNPPTPHLTTTITMQRVIPPNITLYPLWEELEGGSKVGLLCILSEFYPDKLSVEWLLDDKTVTTSPVQRKLQSVEGEEKTFSLSSQLELDQSQWTQGSEVTCKAIHNEHITKCRGRLIEYSIGTHNLEC